MSLERAERDPLIEHVIASAAEEFDVPPALLIAMARCESGLRPDAKSPLSSAAGLFQFLDGSWNGWPRPDGTLSRGARFRLFDRGIEPEPYAPEDVWNPVAASRTAASIVSEGGLTWWDESIHCWGSVAVRTGMR